MCVPWRGGEEDGGAYWWGSSARDAQMRLRAHISGGAENKGVHNLARQPTPLSYPSPSLPPPSPRRPGARGLLLCSASAKQFPYRSCFKAPSFRVVTLRPSRPSRVLVPSGTIPNALSPISPHREHVLCHCWTLDILKHKIIKRNTQASPSFPCR